MARIIVKSSFIRPDNPGGHDHLYNLVMYMATRPGVETVTQGWEQRPPTPGQEQLIRELTDTMPGIKEDPAYTAYRIMPSMATASRFIATASEPLLSLAPMPQIPEEQRSDPATDKQRRLIAQLLKDFPDCKDSLEYEDYLAAPTKGSASELISHAMEENMFQLGSREAYVQYLAMRPGAERTDGHGLFSASEDPPDLHEAASAVANHNGNVFTHIVSLRRADAEKLCMASAQAWQRLLRSQTAQIAKAMHIPPEDLQWYAAFHNESHHPHIHMVAYSQGKEPYMGKEDIKKLKACLAREIFRPELTPTYAEQTAQRNALTEQSRSELDKLIVHIESGSTQQPELETELRRLAAYMQHHKGKAVYGYLPKQAREMVNGIVDRLAQIPEISAIYGRWYEQRDTVTGIYKGQPEQRQALSENKAFKAVKNAVVKTAAELAGGAIFPLAGYPQNSGPMGHNFPGGSEELPLPEIPVVWPDPPAPPIPETAEDFLALHPYPGSRAAPGGEAPPAPGDEAPRFEADSTPPPTFQVSEGNMDDPKSWWSADYKQARLYLYGNKTVQPDLPKAYAAMSALANAGNPLAQSDLARMTMDGLSCDPDPAAAQEWYKKALAKFIAAEKSTKENAYWQYRIGKHHAMGWGTEQDYAQSAAWYEKAVAQGNPFAAYSLAGQYRRGQGVEQDDQRAFGLYTLAAEDEKRPNAYAMYELAIMCRDGIGTEPDPAAAQQWFQSAYRGFEKLEKTVNDDKLWYRLGKIYMTEPDYWDPEKAVSYLEQSAQAGNSYAEYSLGRFYLFGEGSSRDRELGMKYLKSAEAHGNKYAGTLIRAVQQNQTHRAAHGTLGLLHHLEQMFRQRQKPQPPRQQGIDRKLAREIARKKQEQGQKLG